MSKDLVIPDLEGRDRDGVLKELLARIGSSNVELDLDGALRALIERERAVTTAVGYGLAIPHARLPNLQRSVACFGRSKNGVDFKALDGEPTHLFLAILTPAGRNTAHLTALARATRLFRGPPFRQRLIDAEDSDQIWQAIAEQDATLNPE